MWWLEKSHQYPCFSPVLGFVQRCLWLHWLMAADCSNMEIEQDTSVVTSVYVCNGKLSWDRPNKLLSNFLAPPQSLLLCLSITHKHLSREKSCSLEPSKQNMEEPETTSVVNTGESIVPPSAQINVFFHFYFFSSENISFDVIPRLILGSFDALKFPKEQYSTFAQNTYLHVYISPLCLQGIVSYDLPMFI